MKLVLMPCPQRCITTSHSISYIVLSAMFLTPARAEETTHVNYPELPLQPGQIRLIELLPGAWSDPVRCRLFNVLHENAQYETLSYASGTRRTLRKIVVNSKPYPSIINLESALRHLRECNPVGMILWVDALCINQEDMEERTQQVQLMGDIYKMCKKVIVYLGDRLDGMDRLDEPPPEVVLFGQDVLLEDQNPTEKRRNGTDQVTSVGSVFAFLESLASDKHMNAIWDLWPDVNAKGGDPADHKQEHNVEGWRERRDLVEGLRKFMHSPSTPWWSRIWVIQEVAAPPHIEIVYGTCCASWSMLTSADQAQLALLCRSVRRAATRSSNGA